jgi:hypothetical protein
MTHHRSYLALIGLIVLACLVTGCKKKTTVTSVEGVTLKPVPEERSETGWPLYEVRNEGFALSLPPGWRQFDMNPETFEKTFGEMLAKNPQFKELYPNLIQQIRMGVKFFGLEEATMRTGATNIHVAVVPLPPQVTPEQFSAMNISQLEQLSLVHKPIVRERVKTQAGDGERLRYQVDVQGPTARQRLALTTYAFVASGKSYMLTLTTAADREGQYAPTFEKIGESFRFIK